MLAGLTCGVRGLALTVGCLVSMMLELDCLTLHAVAGLAGLGDETIGCLGNVFSFFLMV